MIKNYSVKEQKQNELQWWGEQRMGAIQNFDEKYQRQCEIVMEKLTKEIMDM